MKTTPNPGSPAAMFGGCTCPFTRNANTVADLECPLHGQTFRVTVLPPVRGLPVMIDEDECVFADDYDAEERAGIEDERLAEID